MRDITEQSVTSVRLAYTGGRVYLGAVDSTKKTVGLDTLQKLPHQLCVAGIGTELVTPGEDYYWDSSRFFCAKQAIVQYTVRGEGRLDYRGRTYRLPPGTAFLVCNYDPDYAYHGAPDAKRTWEVMWCVIRPGETLAADMTRRNGPVYRLAPDTWFLGQMRHYLDSGRRSIQMDLAANLRLVYGVLRDLTNAADNVRKDGGLSRLMHAFANAVHTHVDEPLTVASLASRLRVSREHLSRVCQQQMHMSPAAYVSRAKVREAMLLLTEPTASIKEVAAKLGYEYPTHFSRVFRRATGVSPGEFRKSPGSYSL